VEKNCLYYGDNLTVLREHIKDESVDLIYLDPPFNSRQDYNVLFAERDGTRLDGKKIDYPRYVVDATFKKAPKSRKAAEEQIPLGTGEVEEPF
jgi:site-specific DNA-methyltransferase (adenine-specific)